MSDTGERFMNELDLSEDAKTALRHIKAEVEGAHKDRIAELEEDNARLREAGRLWNIDRNEVTTHVDDEGERKHLVAACFDADQDSDKTAYYKGILLVYCARYIQWLEDELWRYQGVPDEMHAEWDEERVREIAREDFDPDSTESKLSVALNDTLKVLDANRMWAVGASRETTRLGQWNLQLRAALEGLETTPIQSDCSDEILGYGCQLCPDIDELMDSGEQREDHHPDCPVGQALAGDVGELREQLADLEHVGASLDKPC